MPEESDELYTPEEIDETVIAYDPPESPESIEPDDSFEFADTLVIEQTQEVPPDEEVTLAFDEFDGEDGWPVDTEETFTSWDETETWDSDEGDPWDSSDDLLSRLDDDYG